MPSQTRRLSSRERSRIRKIQTKSRKIESRARAKIKVKTNIPYISTRKPLPYSPIFIASEIMNSPTQLIEYISTCIERLEIARQRIREQRLELLGASKIPNISLEEAVDNVNYAIVIDMFIRNCGVKARYILYNYENFRPLRRNQLSTIELTLQDKVILMIHITDELLPDAVANIHNAQRISRHLGNTM